MNKFFPIIIIFVLTTSCKDNREPWLKEYQNTKCSWAKKEAEFKADSIQSIKKWNVDLISIKKEIEEMSKPIQSEIALLNHKINEINIKYLNESSKISEAHEQIYGHISTPEFEKKLKQNDENNNREVLTLENKIMVLQSKLKDNKTYQELISKQNQIKERIAKTTTIVKEKYTVTFDSLKHKLDNQNSDFGMILQDLNDTEKQSFKNQRGKIRVTPCK